VINRGGELGAAPLDLRCSATVDRQTERRRRFLYDPRNGDEREVVRALANVTCASCGAEAAPGQRFCADCGTPLLATCPTCGAATQPAQRFCGNCGTALAESTDTAVSGQASAITAPDNGSAPAVATVASPVFSDDRSRRSESPVSERRLVSVLFADLVGFTPFAEERDSEEVRETLSRYFDLATEVITRHGGTVEKFIGDAVMAVWGTPTALEDDAERAVRAALELVKAVPDLASGIEARIGVLTGETAVTLGATNQGMVAGDLVNTAARLQSVAAPSTVLVGESTFRAASGGIAFEPAGEQALKGKTAPVPAWRAVRVVGERGGRNRADSIEAPFVGRDVELRLLKELYHATATEKRMRHVSVVGTGGVGKSRLAWELEKYLDGISETLWWHRGRSPAYGQGITFWSLGEMVRGRAGLAETDDEATTRSRMARLLDERMPGHPDRRWVEQALLELLGIRSGLAPEELFSAWRTFFDALASTGPVLLLFEDLHWADAGTLDFIEHLTEWSRNQPILVVSLARPELLDRRPDWGTARRSLTSVFLEPLSEVAMRQLLTGLVPDLPEATTAAIVSRAEGVPLYAIETVRMLVSGGQLEAKPDGTLAPTGDLGQLAELAVPETLTALIAARLDALDPADRALALDAAVLGQSFTMTGLAAVSGRSEEDLAARLRFLTRREVLTLVADPRSPERGQYQFVQALIREVAYNTLAKKDRKSRHLAAARWFEALGEPELAGALAGHYLAATALAAPGAEAEALATQARIALKAAGDRAADLNVPSQAIAFYEQALSVATDPADQAELHERVGENATISAEFDTADTHLAQAVELHRDRGDRAATARAVAMHARSLLNGKRLERAFAELEAAEAEFADLGDDPARLQIANQRARYSFLRSDLPKALELIEPVLAAAERTDNLQVLADALVTKGSSLPGVRRFREGNALTELGRQIAEANGLHTIHIRAINNAVITTSDAHPKATLERILAGMALARRLGHSAFVHSFSGHVGFLSMHTGDFDAAEAVLLAAVEDATDPFDRAVPVNNLVNVRAMRGGEYGELLAELERTAADPDASPTMRWFLLESRGYVAFTEGRLRDAEQFFRETAAADPAAAGMYAWSGRVAIWLGDPDAAAADSAALWAGLPHEGAVIVMRDTIEAGVAGLRGDRRGAVGRYRDLVGRGAELGAVIDEALLAIDMVYVIGPTEDFVADAITSSRATLTRLGVRPLLDALDTALAHGPHAAADERSIPTAERATTSAPAV
jgi:class 3 adenylate cyclase/tetratricopeptide (TPR) repeat protein